MKIEKRFTLAPVQAQQGFSLVELVTVVIVLGILALSVAPKFSGPKGFSEFAMQKQLLASLRNVQLKAMHDTRANFCYQINIVPGGGTNAAFGPSTASYTSGNEALSCGTAIAAASPDFLRSQANEISDNNLTFSAQDNTTPTSYIRFDSMGRPSSSAGTCTASCTFTFSGQSDAAVCISNQGYVYAC